LANEIREVSCDEFRLPNEIREVSSYHAGIAEWLASSL